MAATNYRIQIGDKETVIDGMFATISVTMDDRCEMEARVRDSNITCFVIGGLGEPLDITFREIRTLEQFARLAERAVAEMRRWESEDAAGLPSRTSGIHLHPGDAP